MKKFILVRVETLEKEVECETYEDALEMLDQQEWGSMAPEIEDYVHIVAIDDTSVRDLKAMRAKQAK